jgi:capsular exopolysaccharide synthesis family protein
MKYQVIEAKENVLASYLDTLKRQMHELNKKSVQYQALKREAESNRRLSHLLLDRLKETSLSADLTNGNNISVIDSAEVPTDPMNVHPTRTVGMAGILGLLAGIGFVGLLGYLDNTLKTPDEAEEFLGFPVIGVIERFRSQSDENPNQLIALESPYGKVSEAFKTLRANLLLSYAEQPRKVYLITSPHPNDGKTTIAANLAVALSQTERRVLLVDADLRNSMVHKLFNIDNQNGLRERLLTETYDPSIVVSGDYPGEGQLSVITAGGDLANPSELLESKRMERFLAYARAHYDVVIIDTPPILAVSDAIVLSPLVDGILIVLRAGVTPYDHARRAIASFLTWCSELSPQADEDVSQSHDTPALGLVMNFLDPRDGEAYGYHHYPTYYYHQES